MSLLIATGICLAALLLDTLLGEPRRMHPLVMLGALANRVERRLNPVTGGTQAAGVLALILVAAVPLLVVLGVAVLLPPQLTPVFEILVLWLAIGLRSLAEHGQAVAVPLEAGQLEAGRTAVGQIVSRDTAALDETGVATAATESMLENGADAVFASLFWFLVAGLPGVVLHRTVNTLDAMWGYRNTRFNHFGRATARLDDLLNYLPARLTALTYALLGRTWQALRCWREQAPGWDSPNAGPVMAAGAGTLNVQLGGSAPYHGQWRERPVLGSGTKATAATVSAAIHLVRRGVLLWLFLMGAVGLGLWFFF